MTCPILCQEREPTFTSIRSVLWAVGPKVCFRSQHTHHPESLTLALSAVTPPLAKLACSVQRRINYRVEDSCFSTAQVLLHNQPLCTYLKVSKGVSRQFGVFWLSQAWLSSYKRSHLHAGHERDEGRRASHSSSPHACGRLD